jgi:hypothetical protein
MTDFLQIEMHLMNRNMVANRSLYFAEQQVITCEPASRVTSMVHSISLRKVTANNATYMEWSTDFSNDATSEVVQDSSFKKLDALAHLARIV